MKLLDLVKYLTNQNKLSELYYSEDLNSESEALLIYMEKKIAIDSEISIFEIEETEDDILFEKNGVQYIQLFPLEYAVSLIEYDLDLKGKGFSDNEIAHRLIDYRLKDA